MKLIFTLALTIVLYSLVIGQSGTIQYKETRKVDIQVNGEESQLKDILPSFNTSTKLLTFTPEESTFSDITGEKDQTLESEQGGQVMKIEIKRPKSDAVLYKNLADNKIIDKRDLLGKYFIIEKAIEKMNWKLLNEQREILGYTCMKATLETEEGWTTAWYTPQIPVPNGPNNWGGLPGMILELDANDGKNIYVATEYSPTDKVEISIPDDGKKVSEEEFEKLREQKMKEMEEMYNVKNRGKKGEGVFIIKG